MWLRRLVVFGSGRENLGGEILVLGLEGEVEEGGWGFYWMGIETK